MATPFTFRSAFHGFHREDVIHYIEYLTAKHTAQINELNAEIAYLRGQLESSIPDVDAPEQMMDAQLQVNEELNQLDNGNPVPQQETLPAQEDNRSRFAIPELQARCAALEKERDQALAALEQSRQQDHAALELETYRRAERTERVARERAEQIYHKTNGVLSQATIQVDGAACEIGEMADHVVEQLKLLQQAVLGSRQALADAAETMYALRPQGE